MTFLSGTPVECTIHPALWPGPRNYTPTDNEASDNDLDWSLYHSDNPEQMVSNFHVVGMGLIICSHFWSIMNIIKIIKCLWHESFESKWLQNDFLYGFNYFL